MNEIIKRLLDAVETVLEDATFFPETDYNTSEMIIQSDAISKLREIYDDIIERESE